MSGTNGTADWKKDVPREGAKGRFPCDVLLRASAPSREKSLEKIIEASRATSVPGRAQLVHVRLNDGLRISIASELREDSG